MSELRHRLIASLHHRRQQHRQRSKIYRALFMMVGLTVTGAGVAMLLLPGPALAVIPLGLAMLALELTWAERLLERALDQAEHARRKASDASRAQKLMVVAAVLLAAGAAVTAFLWWGLPWPPAPIAK